MYPVNAHDLARQIDADRRRRRLARHETHDPRRPRRAALRQALGYRLVVAGWRLIDAPGAAVTAAAAPPGRTAGPRPA